MQDVIYPLTHAQKRIWYTEKFYPGTSISNLSGFGKLKTKGTIDSQLLIEAIRQVIRLNDSMRLRLQSGEDSEPMQYVSEYQDFEIKYTDYSELNKLADVVEWGQQIANQPMDLYNTNLFDFAVFKINSKESWFFIRVHHLITDGISMVLLVNEIIDIYLELAGEKAASQHERPSFLEHIQSEIDYEGSKRFQKDKAFWTFQFASIPEAASLKLTDSAGFITEAERYSKVIPEPLQIEMREFCKTHKVGELSLFLSLLYIYMNRATGQDEVVAGTFMSNRTNAREKQMLGMFVSTLPLRAHVDQNMDFISFVRARMKDQMSTIRHQKYPYNLLVNELREKQANVDKLFNLSLEFQVMEWHQKGSISYVIEPLFSGNEINDISIHVKERWDTGALTIDFDYRKQLFSEDEIECIFQSMMTLLEDALMYPEKKLSELEICSKEEKGAQLSEYLPQGAEYPRSTTLHHLFEQQADRIPDQIAVHYADSLYYTYKELNERSNRIGHLLRENGIGKETPVGILLDRSEKMTAAILGILKAGGAYVPIDPDLPEQRIRFMIKDAGIDLLITEDHLLTGHDFHPVETLVLDEVLMTEGKAGNLLPLSDSHDLAYIIYTSGTTGKPKGVMIEHRQVLHLIEGLSDKVYSRHEPTLNIAMVAPFHFDASVQQLFASLLLGHSLFIVPKTSLSNGQTLIDFYRLHRIEITDGTPAHLQMLLSTGVSLNGLSLKHLLIGGEALPHSSVAELDRRLRQNGTTPVITNVYGPTECCVDASAYNVTAMPQRGLYTPIGKALGNNRLYVLDDCQRLLPPGIPGELHIGGEGVGRGYLNLPELTDQRFIQDPFVPEGRLYKTGDLVSRLPDGNLLFHRRLDDQVKIRGYRIELGEIEMVLQKHAAINKTVVLVRGDSQTGQDLCAFIQFHQTAPTIAMSEIKDDLSRQLPQYMVPIYYVEVDEIPLTSSGKVDRKTLLQYDVATTINNKEYLAPSTELEETLAAIWQDVLGLNQIGVLDDFFDLGGHSLKAIELLSKIHKTCGVEIPLQILFNAPTIRALAHQIGEAEQKDYQSIIPAATSESYPLTSAQMRIYIVNQFEDAGIGYNMPAALMLEGDLDKRRLEFAFRELIQRHEALRTVFLTEDGVPVQKVQERATFQITVLDHEAVSAASHMASFIRPFDLTKAPLMRVGLLQLESNKHMVLFDMHHLISDGVSIGILFNELARLYNNQTLSVQQLQYKDFAVWQTGRNASSSQKNEQYWLEALNGELPVLQLPADYPRPAVQSFAGDRVSILLEKDMKDKLTGLAEASGTTLYMVMLAAYYVLLAKYSGQEDIIVGTLTAGRSQAELENIVGMFVNTLAIRAKTSMQVAFTDFLQNVKHQVLAAIEHQDYPFEKLVDTLNIPRDASRNPLFDTMFILQNAFDSMPEMDEVKLSIYETNFHIAKFDLTMQAKEEKDGITIDLDYSTGLFQKETMEKMLNHYRNLLESIIDNTDKKLGDCQLINENEAKELLRAFNPLPTYYPKQSSIVDLFEKQVSMIPERQAVAFGETTLTYKELDGKANQLARLLRTQGIDSGKVVAILMNRSIEMAVGVLAVLKAGGAYIPIDPEHPVQRIQYFLTDSKAEALLTQHELIPLLDDIEYDGNCVFADAETVYQGDSSRLNQSIPSKQPANLTYTSGTTGQPKGNRVTHANIIRTVTSTNYIEITPQDVVVSLSNYVFDAFIFDLFGSLLNGAKLVLLPKDTILDITELANEINRQKVTVMMITTALFNLLTDAYPSSLSGLRKILFGGERASIPHVRKALQATGKGKLLHMYGPSESTVFTTYYPVDMLKENAASLPIGKPVSNTSVYILDAFSQPLPVGVPGELCVGGDGLVDGYNNKLELTSKKFIEHPIEKNGRIYHTGDMARWLADGNIEFIGRIDHQVKIRGQRIELGEIEHQLLSMENVRKAIVLAMDRVSGDKLLCAYIVADHPLADQKLRDHAAKGLPPYMIPSIFIQLESLPLTPNGKVDRKALPFPELNTIERTGYVAPETKMEEELTDIWKQELGVEHIGTADNFFELGGHSLKAMTLLARVRQKFNVEVLLRTFFTSPTIKGLADRILTSDENSYSSILPAEPKVVYPVSSVQKRMYVLQQLDDSGQSYNMPHVFQVYGKVNLERFEAAINALIGRHEVLRTTFETVEGETVQRINEAFDNPFTFRKGKKGDTDQIISDFIRPFTLQSAPLLRVELVELENEAFLLLLDMHHIISDGVSVNVLFDEITRLYEGKPLQPVTIHYKDYVMWQQTYMQEEAYRSQEAYWLNQMEGELPVLNLPTDRARPAVQSFEGERIAFNLNPKVSKGLRKLAMDTGTTLYMVLLASYTAFLSKLSGQEDIIVGSPIAGRSHPEAAKTVGMFVNTLPMRSHPVGTKAFNDYLLEVKRAALEAYESQDYPLEELAQHVQEERDMSRNPLFDALFVLQNMDKGTLVMDGVQLESYEFDFKVAKFDLSLSVMEEKDAIKCSLEYNIALFDKETISRWIGYYTEMLNHVINEPNVPIHNIRMMTETEQQLILSGFNDTKKQYPRDKAIHELFEEQVCRTPDQVAVAFKGQSITYHELNAKANGLARLLRAKGLHPDETIGIMAEQSIEMIVAILATLKSGAAYLPIDPDYPDDRVRYLIEDSGTKVVLTQKPFVRQLEGMDLVFINDCDQYSTHENLELRSHPEALAYVIYTSGSTGQPKGVMVEHRNVVRLVKNSNYIPFSNNTKMAQTGAVSFDASTFEIFGALLNGGTLYPVPKAVLLDVVELESFLKNSQLTTMWLTSPLFNQLAEESADMFASLEHLIIGGDALVSGYVNKVKRACPALSLRNGYGPTENTTFSCCYLINNTHRGNIPIGKPIANSSAFIINAADQLQPIGIPGELCVGGDGVARGYLGKPELTKEKFVNHPFVQGERVYRTGDLARMLPDGNIEFLGRLDHQVKVRGFRIEPGEIEAQLLKVSGITNAVVMTRQDNSGQNYLCAYITGEENRSITELRQELSQLLPNYMIPSHFMQLEKMPLTVNGKVDRKALPEPEAESARELDYKEPRNELEKLLCLLWQDVLGITQVGINDNFFSLGGDSIKAIQMAARLHKRGWKLKMKDLFQNPTIQEVSLYLEQATGTQATQEPVAGNVLMTPIQHWFFEKHFTDMHHWNQAVMLHADQGFDPHIVNHVFHKLIEHHDALRMVFNVVGDEVSQYNCGLQLSGDECEVIQLDVPEENLEAEIQQAADDIQQSINLSKGPLVKTALFQTGYGDHLLIVIHHLVVDGVSWRILLEDFERGYRQIINGESVNLPEKTHAYKEWATGLKDYANTRAFLNEKEYWKQFEDISFNVLPKDHSVRERKMKHTQTAEFSLTEAETEALTTKVHEAYHTEMNDLLLTAVGLAVQKWTGDDRVLINLEGHGREEILAGIDISRTVGWFTTQYPVALDISFPFDLSYQIKRIKEDLRHIPDKGIGYGLIRYLTEEGDKSGLSFSCRPEIGFNYLGQFTDTFETDGFRRSKMPVGNLLSPDTEAMHPIDIVGAIEDNKLRLTILYNSLEFKDQTMNRLKENIYESLLALIEHCLNKENTELTPSDFGDDTLTLEELENLQNMF